MAYGSCQFRFVPKLIIVLLLVVLLPMTAFGCLRIDQQPDPAAEPITSTVQSEQAVIIWDAATHTEHFIREADFLSRAPTIGFIVPTPTTPELVEVDPAIYEMAEEVTGPKKVPPMRPRNFLQDSILGVFAGNVMTFGYHGRSLAPDDMVIKQQDVAGYHATVLDASDITQLNAWLVANKFEWRPSYTAWLAPYIKKHWKITAFQLINLNGADGFKTGTIRMSFTTDKPFFPYSEPKSDDSQPRELAVTVLSNQYMLGALAEGTEWPCDIRFIGSSAPDPGITSKWKAEQWLELAKLSSTMALPKCLTAFRDFSNPRPGTTDLEFTEQPSLKPLRLTVTDQSLPTVYRWDFTDYIGLGIMFLIVGTLVFTAVRAWQKATMLRKYHAYEKLPPSPPFLGILDTLAAVFSLCFGFTFALCPFFIPFAFFIKASGTLLHWEWINPPHTLALEPLTNEIVIKLSAVALVCAALLYLALAVSDRF